MSVIIGCIRKEKVLMATDTQRTWDDLVSHARSAYASNVLWMPNQVMVGITGDQTVKYAVAIHREWFEDLRDQSLTKQYIIEKIIPPLYQTLKELDAFDERDVRIGQTRFDGMIMLAQQNKLYCIDSDFSVITVADYCLIGNGSEYAAPRMEQYHTALSDQETLDLLEQSLEDAATFSMTTSAPFRIGDTLGNWIEMEGKR